MTLLSRVAASVTPRRAAHLFAVSNIAFLGVDIALAHKANDFARRVEWAPIVFSAVATLLLLPGALRRPEKSTRVVIHLDRIAGWGAIIVGVTGMVLHLQSAFFAAQTLHNLVYSAPFVAPVSYVGVGLLIILLRSKEAETEGPAFASWLLLLTLGGFLGNFALSVLDHAQNGFFHATEWIPVASAAFAVGFLAMMLARPDAKLRRACYAVMGVQVLVGVVGFVLHVAANLQKSTASTLDRFVFGAPAFAPLLFADLALLAAIGLWASARASEPTPALVLEERRA